MSEITIAVQCHNFQRRFLWMLSSLVQQIGKESITVDVAYIAGNGNPTIPQLAQFFANRITIRELVYETRDIFQYRGLVRNAQLKRCSTPWLMFGDCDMVYSVNYFGTLLHELTQNHSEARYMLSTGRTSNPVEITNHLVNDRWKEVGLAETTMAFARADQLPKRGMRNCGAGFSQIINIENCPHEGYYVKPEENKDWSWARGSNPKSDMQFRKRIGETGGSLIKLGQWYADKAIHLNHNRDPEAGRHLEDQR